MRAAPTGVGRRILAVAVGALVALPVGIGASAAALAEPAEPGVAVDAADPAVEPSPALDPVEPAAAATEASGILAEPSADAVGAATAADDPAGQPQPEPEPAPAPEPSATGAPDQADRSTPPVSGADAEPSADAAIADAAADAVAEGIAPGEVRGIPFTVVDASAIHAVVTAPIGVDVRLADAQRSTAWRGADTTRKFVSMSNPFEPMTGEFVLEIRNGTDRAVQASHEIATITAGSPRLDPRVSLTADRLTITAALDDATGQPVSGAAVGARITGDNGIWFDTTLTEVRTGVYETVTAVMRSGDYTVRVVTEVDGVPLAAVALGRIVGPDATGPEVAIATDPAQPGPSGWHRGEVDVVIEATDPQGVFVVWYQVGDGPLRTSSTATVRVPLTDDGEQTVTAWAWDRLNNISDPVATTVRVDRTGPTASVTGALQTGSIALDASAEASFSCADPHSGVVDCRLEFESGLVLRDGDLLPSEAVGVFDWSIVAVNGAGASTRAIGQLRVTDDASAPSIVVTTVPAASNARGWFARDVLVEIVASDPGAGVAWVEVSVDGAAWQRVSGNRAEVLVDRDGEAVIRYRAADLAGNVTGDRERLVRVDRVAPVATVDPSIDGATVAIGAELPAVFSCEDAHSGVLDCLGSTPLGATLPTGAAGVFELSVTAVDRAGNSTTTRVEYEVVAAPLAATATPTTPANEHGWWRDVVVVELAVVPGSGADTVHWELEGAQSGSGEAAERAEVVVSAEGRTRVLVRASDANGSSEPIALDVAIDREAPRFWHSLATPESLAPPGSVPGLPTGLRVALGETVHFAFGCVEDDLSELEVCESDLQERLLPTGVAGEASVEFRAADAAGNERVEVLRYTVVDPSTRPGPLPVGRGGTERLPATGAPVGAAVMVSAILLGAGALAVLAPRTRRR